MNTRLKTIQDVIVNTLKNGNLSSESCSKALGSDNPICSALGGLNQELQDAKYKIKKLKKEVSQKNTSKPIITDFSNCLSKNCANGQCSKDGTVTNNNFDACVKILDSLPSEEVMRGSDTEWKSLFDLGRLFVQIAYSAKILNQ